MFQLFLRARTNNYFRARSANRDAETDTRRVASIVRSIEDAIAATEGEWSGLNERVNDVLERAAITSGNDSDEYLSREPSDARQQKSFDNEISNGRRRLEELSHSIKHFRFLKAALLSRFPDFKAPPDHK
jgi:hypothetical protein